MQTGKMLFDTAPVAAHAQPSRATSCSGEEWSGVIDVDRRLLQRDIQLFASSDIDEIRSLVGRVIKPHHLTLVGGGRLRARMHHSALGGLEISRLKYGHAVQIERTTHLGDFFLVQMPLHGATSVKSGHQNITNSAQLASVLNPHDEVSMEWAAESDILMLRISKALVERCLVGHLGHALDQPLEFQLDFDWRKNSAWLGFVRYLAASAPHFKSFASNTMLVNQLEQMAATLLLSCHAHSYSSSRACKRMPLLPRHVKRAQDYIDGHAHEPISVTHIAQAAGVSVRSLYAGFKDVLGTSPMQYLRELRLEKVRAELLGGSEGNVAGVAHRWGFQHMGRFSGEYKKKYGESPVETMRRQ
jgi:AraC-like DNA-binding protein